jgi:hypothetical protein
MTLREINAFCSNFDILVERLKNGKIKISVIQEMNTPIIKIISSGSTTEISLK